jgi:valyl-tRNA synthetase
MLPLMNREIPIIRDSYVDMGFGTGGLKVTPAHDPNDFEIGRRHGLPNVKVIGDNGVMTAEAGRYQGLERSACRKTVIADLKAAGLLEKMEPHRHSVGHCYRCRSVIEPNLSRQWFVRAKPLAEKAITAVRQGSTHIIPEAWTNTYFDWMENIRDWCISRQIWWGHQIPAWTCGACGEIVVAMETPLTCSACGSDRLVQEEDVLDTWFSSALWPFSTMGWPDQTPLLATFYPTSVLVTAFDILFFWVARMMMMGLHCMQEVPFRDVYIHAIVRDEEGQKMSKSKGNVIDPLEIIERYGTDAFRFTLAAFAAQGRDIKMSDKRVEGYRHFINKLWNAARFTLMHLDRRYEMPARDRLSLVDRWILSRLSRTAANVRQALDAYRFNDAAADLYRFVWHEFCDWYLEAIKPALQGKCDAGTRETALAVLGRVLRDTLILLHPFVPFVTEEIWHKLPDADGSIMRAAFPGGRAEEDALRTDTEAETTMELLIDVISGIRNIRGEMGIAPGMSLDAVVFAGEAGVRSTVLSYKGLIVNLARLKSLAVTDNPERPPASATGVVRGGATIYVRLEGVIDFVREIDRLEKDLGKAAKELSSFVRKLQNQDFLAKAPADVVAKVRAQQQALLEKQQKLQTTLDKIRSYDSAS